MTASTGGGRALCGAKTRSGRPCRNVPMAGSLRCKFHGGATPLKHGIYAKALSPEEKAQWSELPLNELDQAIRFQWVLCQRSSAWLRKIQDEPTTEQGFEASEIKRSGTKGGKGGDSRQHTEITTRRPDYRAIYDRQVARLAKLMIQRDALFGGDSGNVREKARQLKAAIAELEEATSPNGDDEDEAA